MTPLTDRQLLEDLIKDVAKVKIALKGYNGQEGLCDKVEQQGKAITRLWLTLALIVPASAGGGMR